MVNEYFKRIRNSDAYGIIEYAFIYSVLIFSNCLPRILAEFGHINMTHISNTFQLPLDIFSWGLMGICTIYTGLDRKSLSDTSATMEYGKINMGDTTIINLILKVLLFIFIESALLNLFFGNYYTLRTQEMTRRYEGISLPLLSIGTAYVSTKLLYINGNRLIKSKQYISERRKIDYEKENFDYIGDNSNDYEYVCKNIHNKDKRSGKRRNRRNGKNV